MAAKARELERQLGLTQPRKSLLGSLIKNAQAAEPTSGPSVIGAWGPVQTWPFAFATAANLPDGRILALGGNRLTSFNGGSNTFASTWDPKTGEFATRNHSDHSMFCGIPVMLEDGRVFLNGGDGTRERASTFDFSTDTWQRVQDMHVGRWYPGTVALPNGDVFTALGDPGSSYPEVWSSAQGWRYLTGANLDDQILNLTAFEHTQLPYFHLAPNGLIFHSGPTQQMNWINPAGAGTITSAGLVNAWYPKYSNAVMYDTGKLLVTGGATAGGSDLASRAATNRAMIIDLNGANPVKTDTNHMTIARRFHSAVILPTGEVMQIGGTTAGIEFSDVGTQLIPEIWNPDTQTWRQVAGHDVPRNYHSVALLMTDGRVWSGGGGLCDCPADHPDAQVFSPPYLFNSDGSPATRPVITSAPTATKYGRAITVQATAGLSKFNLVKMSATTHDLNSDLRLLKVPFTEVSSGVYQLNLNPNVNVLTPGYWMLFGINSQGTPSVAHVMGIRSTDTPLVERQAAVRTLFLSTVSLPISASDPNGDTLTFSATGLPPGLTIHPQTGVIGGVASATGSYLARVNVSDGVNTASISFQWDIYLSSATRFVKLEAVSEADGLPWASAAEWVLLDEAGQPMSTNGMTISTDSEETSNWPGGYATRAIDGNPSTVWHTQFSGGVSPPHPHWLSLDLGEARKVTGFVYSSAPHEPRIKDYRFYKSSDAITWTLVQQGQFPNDGSTQTVIFPVNRDPSISIIDQQQSLRGSTVSFQVNAADPDGDPITYSATGLPPGLAINAASGMVSGTPTQAGTFDCLISVQDNRGGVASLVFKWTIAVPAFTISPITATPKPVNTAITYSATVQNAASPRFKWQFGDNTPETAYSTSSTISHSFQSPGLYLINLTVTDDSGIERQHTFTQAIHNQTTANLPVASTSITFEDRSTGNDRIWVVNPDNDSVTAFDSVTYSKLAEIPVGQRPHSLAIAPNGRLWVTNRDSATISVINTGSLTVTQTLGTLPMGSRPAGLAFSPGSGDAFVVLEALGRLVKLNSTAGTLTSSLDIGPNPRHVSITGDGSRVLVSRFITRPIPGEGTAAVQTNDGTTFFGGEVLAINPATMTLVSTITLRHSDKGDLGNQGRGIPNYLAAPVIAPDGQTAWVPSKQDNIKRGVLRDANRLDFQTTVRAIASRIDLALGAEDHGSRIDFDNAGVASGSVFNPTGNYLFVALETNRQIAMVDAYGNRELGRAEVGRAPQGLAVSPDGNRLFVHDFMDRTVSVLDLTALNTRAMPDAPILATLHSVGTEKLDATVLLGKQLFYDARDVRLAKDSYLSCASCHDDGEHDGRVWDLTGFGEGLRNTISLKGRSGTGHGFLHWSANFDEIQDFEGQIRNLSGGTGLMTEADFAATESPLGAAKAGRSAELDALAAYLSSLNQLSLSPHRSPDGRPTAEGLAGKAIFKAKNCASCHRGSRFSDSGAAVLHDIGTVKASSGKRLAGSLTGIDTPTLRDTWASAPYLHDGSAPTLADAVRAHSGVTVSATEINSLTAYLQQIDRYEPAPEAAACSTGIDLDTDDDGIADTAEDPNQNGVVETGETHPCLADSDGDGLQDGTELGVTAGVGDPDGAGPLTGTNLAVFIPDADPTTTTSPTSADSDGDGTPDGFEDSNRNGRVDVGESNPNASEPSDANVPVLGFWPALLLASLLAGIGVRQKNRRD